MIHIVPAWRVRNARIYALHMNMSRMNMSWADRLPQYQSDWADAVLQAPGPAVHPVCGLAARLAVASHRDRASAAALPAVDYPEGFRAAALTAALA